MKKILTAVFIIFIFYSLSANERSYTISMMGTVIGKSTEKWSEEKIGGKCLIKLVSNSNMEINRGGFSIAINAGSIVKAACHDLSPVSVKSESSEISSKVVGKASVTNGILSGEIAKNNMVEKVNYKVPSGSTFFGMIFRKLSEKDLLKGGKTKIISEESLALKEISYSAVKDAAGLLKATINYDGVLLNFTIDDGVIVRSDMQNGLIVYKLDGYTGKIAKNTAPGQIQQGDILENTSIKNLGINIKDPRKSIKMNFQLSGSNLTDIPETCFQKITVNNGSAVISVDNTNFSCKEGILPQDTQPNLYEDSTNSSIVVTAQKIVKGAVTKDEKIKRMVNFVFRHISNKNYQHGNLSASEVLAKKAGDCTEHSTLLSALLKSQNIPVKMVYGLVLDNSGRFMFHNWNEALGDNGWITVDSTFGLVRADAARITLIYGGSSSSSRENVSLTVLKFVKSLKISVRGFVYGN